MVHLNPAVGKECSFCGVDETVDHLFVCCERIRGLLGCLREWCGRLGEVFSPDVFISAPVVSSISYWG